MLALLACAPEPAPSAPSLALAPPAGGSAASLQDFDGDGWSRAEDCDDGVPIVYPGAPERCDLWDNDCDGARNEEPVDGRTWFADTDADGFGDPATSVVACRAPAGHVANAHDCDDTNAQARPRGRERCDGVDNDCDGAVDEDPIDLPTWYADADADGLGDRNDTVAACEVPTGYVATGTDCDDADPAVDDAAHVLLAAPGTLTLESCWTERNCVDATWTLDPAGTFVSTTASYAGTWAWDCTQGILEVTYDTGAVYLGMSDDRVAFSGPNAAPDGQEGGWSGTLAY